MLMITVFALSATGCKDKKDKTSEPTATENSTQVAVGNIADDTMDPENSDYKTEQGSTVKAEKAGILIGIYFFSTATNTAEAAE